jgi:uncharacterized protein YggT (Ycf19 family)
MIDVTPVITWFVLSLAQGVVVRMI